MANIQKGVLETIIFSVLGIIFCVLGYKVVDWLVPGNMGKQIADDKNLALAVVAGAMILGICIIVAASIHG
ncbi:MAG: hypothetical protein A2309_01385 [Bacteroidetes bacterium RIFOXYB2_FULL_35_7]|nr:MAG: hypothetical protein A2X01_00655 [Bacteroidetes bacterium GWF2_35_48]OFY93828.1 MAG: hypothetical protein A2309_01385 [Bacteroidetes bacterium RIFOXYB2_FULL_35_7]OFY96610.1 MAG: hypothetical protein A2491_03010 [Bacteroidetes bacterium RIFOXYC12_FULL_35_7]